MPPDASSNSSGATSRRLPLLSEWARPAFLFSLAVVTGCKATAPPPDPSALVALRLQVPGEESGRATVTVTADDGPPLPLRRAAGNDEYDGTLPLPPGEHRLRIERQGPGARPLTTMSLPVHLAPGATAQLVVTVPSTGQAQPIIRALTASGSSSTVGESLALEAILDSAPASLSWSTDSGWMRAARAPRDSSPGFHFPRGRPLHRRPHRQRRGA